MSTDPDRFDVVIVGGGPAGLSAALVLARARRRVVVCDSGRPRNARSRGVHGFLTRDGIAPGPFLALGREEVHRYGVGWRQGEATGAWRDGPEFVVELRDGARIRGQRLLIATGVQDRIPELPGLDRFYGRSVHHCPYCDGWEWRDGALAAYGRGRAVAALALSLRAWSDDVVLLTDGQGLPSASMREELMRARVPVFEQRVLGLEGDGDRMERIVLAGAESLPRDALFLATGSQQASGIASSLGCRFTGKGALWTDRKQRTNVPGVYAAGDASRDVQFVVVAAAEGAKAGVAIHTELQEERLVVDGSREAVSAHRPAVLTGKRLRPDEAYDPSRGAGATVGASSAGRARAASGKVGVVGPRSLSGRGAGSPSSR